MNATTDETSCLVPINPTAHKIGVTIAFCLIFVVSLVGNSLIGVIVYETPTLRKPINFLIVNMAMSDLLLSSIFVPVRLVYLHLQSWAIAKGVFANIICKVTPFLCNVSILVSIQSLVVIAVDRFVVVVFPLHLSFLTSKRCLLCIVFIWIVSMLVNSPDLYANMLFEVGGKFLCVPNWKEAFGDKLSRSGFSLGIFTLFVFIPSFLLIILYTIIFVKLKSQKIQGEGSTHSERQRVKRNKNVMKMAVAIVFAFMLCQLPRAILFWLVLHVTNLLPCAFRILLEIALFLSLSYSAVNPCICFAFSENYREGLKKVLKFFSCPAQNGERQL